MCLAEDKHINNFTLLIGLIRAFIFVKLNHHVKFAQNATNLNN